MNIQYLQKLLSRLTEIKILGKTAEINGTICHFMGIVRYERRLRLLVLQYDEDFAARTEEVEIETLNAISERAQSNRERLHGDREINLVNIFQTVHKVNIGEAQFNIEETEGMRCDMQNWEIAVMFTEFLRFGWNPNGIDYQNIGNLFLTVAELSGEYALIPDLGENPVLRLQSKPDHTPYLVEQPVTLVVGAEYSDKLWFQDRNTGEEHWMRINRVYLFDMWKEAMNSFNDPRFKEKFTSEELEKNKADFESHLLTICPKEMCFPVIEYECEEGITLQFYSKAWLDAAPVYNSSCIGFIMKPDEKSGVLGLPLKTAMIQESMPGDTLSIEAELFWYNKLVKHPDVII